MNEQEKPPEQEGKTKKKKGLPIFVLFFLLNLKIVAFICGAVGSYGLLSHNSMIRRYVKIQGVSISLGESALFLAAGFLAFIIAVFPWSAVARVMKAVSAPVARGMKAVSAHAARGGKAGLATARGMKAKTFKRIAVATIIVLTATISMFAIIYVMLEDHATHRSWKVFKAHQHMKKLAWGARDFHKAERKSNNGKTLKPRFPKSTKWTPAKTCCSMSGQDRCDPDNFYNDRPTDQNLKSIEQKGWVEIAGPKKDRMKLWWVRDDPPATFRFKMKRSKNKKKMTMAAMPRQIPAETAAMRACRTPL